MKLKLSTKEMILAAIFAALTGILAQISIPIKPVPVTFQILAIYLSSTILGSKLGFLSQIVYILLGAAGLPVFANFGAGLNSILGPTGGYLISFPLIAFIIGKFSEKDFNIIVKFLGLAMSLLICYSLGVLQLSFITKMSIQKSILVGALPFLPLDFLKIIAAYFLGTKVRETLLRGNLLKC